MIGTHLKTWAKKFISGVTSLALILNMAAIQNVHAVGDLTIDINLPAGAGFNTGAIGYEIENTTGTVISTGAGTGTFNSVFPGNYQLDVNIIPAGFIVNGPNPIPFTITDNVVTTVTIDIIADPATPLPPSGDLTVNFNLPSVPGLNSGQFGYEILDGTTTVTATGAGDGTFNNVLNGAYTLNVNVLPQGYLVGNATHPIPFTIIGGQTTNIIVDILIDPANPPPGVGGDLTVTFNLPAFPGINSGQFGYNLEDTLGAVIATGAGDGTFNNILAADYQLNVNVLPTGFIVGNTPHPIPFTITTGNSVNIIVDILIDPANPPGGPNGDLNITFNLPGGFGLNSGQFGYNIEDTLSVVISTGAGDGTFNNILPNNYQLNVNVLPTGFIVGNTPHPIPFTITSGQLTNVVVDILIDPANPPGGTTGDLTILVFVPSGSGITTGQIGYDLEDLGGVVFASGAGVGTFNTIIAANYQVDVNTIPAGFQISGANPIPFTITAGNNTTVIINIIANPPVPTTGSVSVAFTAPIGTNVAAISHTLTDATPAAVGTLLGNNVYNNLAAGNFNLTVDNATLPAGLQIQGGTNIFPAVVTIGSTFPIVVILEPIQNPNTGDIAVQINAPVGVNVAVVEHTLTEDAGPYTNTLLGNSVYSALNLVAHTLTVNLTTIPAGFQIQGGVNTFPATPLGGQTVTITVTLEPISAPTSGDIAVQFNAPLGVNVATIEHTLTEDAGPYTNTLLGNSVYTALVVGSYTLTVNAATLPAGFQLVGGINTFGATVVAGATVTITVTLVPIGTTGDIAVQINAPVGVIVTAVSHTLTEDAGPFTGTLLGNNVYSALNPGGYTLTVDVLTIPAGHVIQGGTNVFTATVTAGNTSTITITLIPIGGNSFPGITFTQGGLPVTVVTVTPGVAMPTVTVTATDPDVADNLTLSLQTNGIPSGAGTFVTINGVSPISGPYDLTAAISDGGATYNVVFRVVDGTATIDVILQVIVLGGPGFTVAPLSTTTTEAGTTAQYQISLNTVPTADVTVTVTSNDLTEGTVSPAFLTFTVGNGTNPLTVTVTGVPDGIIDGNIVYIVINGVATSADLNYNGRDPADVAVTNIDIDGPTGGGGGGRLFGQPTIHFYFDGVEINEINVPVNAEIAIEVVATTTRYSTNLRIVDDPSDSGAVFVVPGDNPSLEVIGTFTLKPGQNLVGSHAYLFKADSTRNSNFDEKTLTVNVTSTAPTESGVRENIINTTDPLARCRYDDNQTESVLFLCLLGIIDGPTSNSNYNGRSKNNGFGGNQLITRAAFTKIMINITYERDDIQKVADLIQKNNFYAFPDVEPSAWFSPFISVGKIDNHVQGYESGEYIPWNEIEISEAVKILFNTARHILDFGGNWMNSKRAPVLAEALFLFIVVFFPRRVEVFHLFSA